MKSTISASSSSDWVVNGLHSLKILNETESIVYQTIKIYILGLNEGDTVTFKCKILNKSISTLTMGVSENVNGGYSNLQTVTVPTSDNMQEITISGTISQEISSLVFAINQSNGELYIDDLFCMKE